MRSRQPAVFALLILVVTAAAGVWASSSGRTPPDRDRGRPAPPVDARNLGHTVVVESHESVDLVIGNPDRSSGPREVVLRAVPVTYRENVMEPRCSAEDCVGEPWLASGQRPLDSTGRLQPGAVTPAELAAPAIRRFWVPTRIDPGFSRTSFQPVSGSLVQESARVAVYLDDSIAGNAEARAAGRRIGQTLDEVIVPGVERLVGELPDVDSDRRVTLLVTPLLEQLGVTETPLRAFVRSVDLDASCDAPVSNRADLIYLNATRLDLAGLWPVLAHETAHLATFALRDRATGRLRDEDWLDEGLAHAVELEVTSDWSNLKHRVDRFLQSPHSAPLALCDEDAAVRWRDPACRGAAALFLHYLRGRFGPQVYTRLASKEGRGCSQCELATETVFAELFRDWSVSLCRDGVVMAAGGPRSGTPLRPHRSPWCLIEPIRLTLQGSTFDCLHVTVPASDAVAWRIEAVCSRGEPVQLTVIPHRPAGCAVQAADR